MASWVDLSGLHTPAAGTRPPASWGLGVDGNLDFLSGTAASEILTFQTRALNVYGDLATVGPSVSVDTGASALVLYGVTCSNAGAGGVCLMAFAISGATTVAATDDRSIQFKSVAAGDFSAISGISLVTGLTPGVNVFTAKYRIEVNTGTFARRTVVVIPIR